MSLESELNSIYEVKVVAHIDVLRYFSMFYRATAIVMTITTVALSWIAIATLDRYTTASTVIFGVGSITTVIIWKKTIWELNRLIAELVKMEMERK